MNTLANITGRITTDSCATPTACQPPSRESEVTAELNRLRSGILLAADNLGVLVQRLEPVLRTQPGAEACPKDAKVEKLTPLAQAIRDESAKVRSMAEFIASVTSRLEI